MNLDVALDQVWGWRLHGIPALRGVERIQAEVINEEDVDGEGLSEFGFIGTIETGVDEILEHLIGPGSVDGEAAECL